MNSFMPQTSPEHLLNAWPGEGGILLGAKLDETKKVVIVEDVMTAGTSIYETAPILKEQGNPQIQGLIISVDRMERGKGEKSAQQEIKEVFGITTYSIVTMKEVESCPPLGNLPDPGTEPVSLMSNALAGGFFTTSTTWEVFIAWENTN